MSDLLWRIQDDVGRGPFRPGFSHRWSNGGDELRPPALVMRPGWQAIVAEIRASGLHCGTGCRSRDALREWFKREEIRRLMRLGYRVVVVQPDRIFAEWPEEVIFGCRLPLSVVAREPRP